MEVEIVYKGQHYMLPIIIVAGKGPNLLRWNWFNIIEWDWSQMFYIRERKSKPWQQMIDKYIDVFQDELGTKKGVEATYTYQKVRHQGTLNPDH